MYHWFYIWSPKYEIFHHVLQQGLQGSTGFIVHPTFLPQSVFEPKAPIKECEHFFTGNPVKFRLLLSALVKHPGEFIILSDADLLVFDYDNTLADCFKQYEEFDMTFMREGPGSDRFNIGTMFVKSTPETIAFFRDLIHIIETTNAHDQTLLNEKVGEFGGRVGYFSADDFAQSIYVNADSSKIYKIIQCLSSLQGYENVLIEKLITVCLYFDITPFRHLLASRVINNLVYNALQYDSISYLTTWKLEPLPLLSLNEVEPGRSFSFAEAEPSSEQTAASVPSSSHPHPPEPPLAPSLETTTSPETPQYPRARDSLQESPPGA